MGRFLFFLCIIFFVAFFSDKTFAQSSYVLPYPSFMPGSKFYQLRLILDEIKKYWYFGDFGQFHYNLQTSDKYLVEAKTLFDYKQYLLASNALKKSDMYFSKTYPTLLSAKDKEKNIFKKKILLKEASQKHVEELIKIRSNVPRIFGWNPEKENPTTLKLWEFLDKSIEIRQKIL